MSCKYRFDCKANKTFYQAVNLYKGSTSDENKCVYVSVSVLGFKFADEARSQDRREWLSLQSAVSHWCIYLVLTNHK